MRASLANVMGRVDDDAMPNHPGHSQGDPLETFGVLGVLSNDSEKILG